MKNALLCILLFILTFPPCALQADNNKPEKQYKHSLDACPLSPVINIYAVHYSYKFNAKNEFIIGPSYMRIQYENIGHTDAPGFIAGYRHYFWKKLHVDYQLMPMWDRFYDTEENKQYHGFDLWNEFRVGYMWDFKIANLPLFLNVQWPFGFALYSDSNGKPESFKKHAKENPYFYFPPLFFIGIRF